MYCVFFLLSLSMNCQLHLLLLKREFARCLKKLKLFIYNFNRDLMNEYPSRAKQSLLLSRKEFTEIFYLFNLRLSEIV